jgi:large subunit ribosomal protein L15
MKYNELQLIRNKDAKRSGRGIAAGRGMTAGRGTKGQGARKSGGVRPGFEGGQMPLYMRIPKMRGFKSKRTPDEVIYTGQLDALKKAALDNNDLFEAGLVSSPYVRVKLVLKGGVSTKKDLKIQGASTKATEAVAKAGGSVTTVERLARQPKPKAADKK